MRFSSAAPFAMAAVLFVAAASAGFSAGVVLPNLPRPYKTIQPVRPAPAKHLVVIDAEGIDHDRQLLLASLQGVVNRSRPRLYIVWGDDDRFWLGEMQRRHLIGSPIMVSDPMSVVTRFRSDIAGAVVPDPNVYESPCIAVDFAGLDNVVIATPALAAQLHLPIVQDLRGRFKSDADALAYARLRLLPKMNAFVSLCLDPPILGSQVDDIIAARGTCFWVTGPKEQNEPGANTDAELAQVKGMLSEMPLGAVVRGFWWRGDGNGLDEGPGVALASRYGKITTVSDYVADYSVTSGMRIARLRQKRQPPAPPLDKSKVYLAITVSDGDNLCTWRGYFRRYFTDPLHGTFPIAFGIGPTLLDVAPEQAEWYYRHAAPTDEFICDVSGAGYIYPPLYGQDLAAPHAALAQFYRWTAAYMNRLDMHTVRLMNIDPATIAEVGADLPRVGFLMPDYGWSGEPDQYAAYTYTLPTGQPVFRAITSSAGAGDMAAQIRRRVGDVRPAFINVFVINWSLKLADMQRMLHDLGPDYVPVTPTQLATLYKKNAANAQRR